MPRIQQLLRKHICQRPILHLSFFDGIGAASFALQYLGANIVFTLSWETNPQCQALLQHHFQSIQHGDVSLLTIILITSGPPCVDFSRLRNLPPGMQGEQGNLLSRPEGPTLWLHHVLLFGSAASVWSYNRFGDVLTSLSRVLTATPVVHFVDDYGSIQPARHAMSGFQAFGHLNSTLGFHMKTSKEQPPQHEHKIQGVLYPHGLNTHYNQTLPTTNPADHDDFEASHRHQLITALTRTKTCWQVCLHSYTTIRKGRQSSKQSIVWPCLFQSHAHLDKPTKQGILAMIDILQHAQPRVAPLVPTTFQPTIIYTDAYYQIDGVHKRCCDLTEEDLQHAHKDLPNGWGIVVFSPGKPPIVTSGHVPPNLLHQFTSSRAFIYFLEAWTAVIAPVLFQPLLTQPYIQLCDNEASKHAIIKGTGKHQPLNNIIGAHWTWHNRCQLHQILDRVPSKANIADPFSRGVTLT